MSLLIVVLSDTHISGLVDGSPNRILPEELFPHLKEADLILHAGDIVGATVLAELAAFAPVRAIKGNWDFDPSLAHLPQTLKFECSGKTIAMIHNSGLRAGRRKRLLRSFPDADVVVFGHSHMPGVEDEDGCLLLNPGSILGLRRPSGNVSTDGLPMTTCALLHIQGGNIHGEIVDLKKGARYQNGYYPPLSVESPKRPKRADFTAANRKLLLEKSNYGCQSCSSTKSLEISHILPVSEGGRGTLDNGLVLCRHCRVEKTRKDRRRKELNKYLEKEPARILSDYDIDLKFDHLLRLGAFLPVSREELYGLTVKSLVSKLSEKEADHLALDLIRSYISDDHGKYYGIEI